MKTFKEKLQELNACLDAVDWVGDKTLDGSWARCDRGDWMLWLAARVDVDRRLIVSAACDCAELADRYLKDRTRGPTRNAIATARRWVDGGATADECRAASAAAADAYEAAPFVTYVTHASYAAADAAAAAYANTASTAADAAARAAAHAAAYANTDSAAADAADAADAAANTAYAAYFKTLNLCADIVRKYITAEMIAEKLK